MINLKDIKSAEHISDPTEEKLNDLKLVSQETDKEIVSTQGENTKDILRARSIERLDALNEGSEAFDNKIGERETSVTEELTEITDRTETIISDSEKYTEDIEAFLSVAKGDDFLFFLDDCTRAVGRLDKLTNGYYLCYRKKITSWDIPLPLLADGRMMFSGCSNLKNWNADLPMLRDAGSSYGSGMFSNDSKLEEWVGDLHALEIGNDMFYSCVSLSRFSTSALPSLKYAPMMFHSCKLPSWNVDLPVLIKGVEMFKNNTKLTSWNIDLPSMTDGGAMFVSCTSLTSFKGDLSALNNNYYFGQGMFDRCTSLTSFNSGLPSLTEGTRMFNGCKLDLASVQNIADTINNLDIQSKTGNITIGIDASLCYNDNLTEEEQPDATVVKNAITTIVTKGWIVTEQYN